MDGEEKIVVRALRAQEPEALAQIEEIERISFSVPWSHDNFLSALRYPQFLTLLAAFRGETVLGYAVLFVLYEDAEVQNLAVAPAFRLQGIARDLLRACEEKARCGGANALRLEVRQSNVGAQALYRSEGFRQTGTRKRYYREPVEDALLLEKRLSSAPGGAKNDG